MGALSSWVDGNWFNVIQTVGIIGSLWLATGAANRDARAKEIENLLSLSEHHRDLWKEVPQQKDLERVLQADANVLLTPATVVETEFLNLVIVHFQTGWWIARAGGMTTLKELKSDIRDFFTFPLPRAVWEKTKGVRNIHFVRFVERALNDPAKTVCQWKSTRQFACPS
jgi:hypothetical protein